MVFRDFLVRKTEYTKQQKICSVWKIIRYVEKYKREKKVFFFILIQKTKTTFDLGCLLGKLTEHLCFEFCRCVTGRFDRIFMQHSILFPGLLISDFSSIISYSVFSFTIYSCFSLHFHVLSFILQIYQRFFSSSTIQISFFTFQIHYFVFQIPFLCVKFSFSHFITFSMAFPNYKFNFLFFLRLACTQNSLQSPLCFFITSPVLFIKSHLLTKAVTEHFFFSNHSQKLLRQFSQRLKFNFSSISIINYVAQRNGKLFSHLTHKSHFIPNTKSVLLIWILNHAIQKMNKIIFFYKIVMFLYFIFFTLKFCE